MTELTPYTATTTIIAGIEAATDLRALAELLGDTTTPSPSLHRRFRVDPGELTFFGDAAPGDSVGVRQTFGLVLFHRYDAVAHAASWQLASDDFVSLLRAVLTRAEFSGLGQPIPVRARPVRRGHQIEQTLTITAQYSITLPDAQE